MQSIGKTDKGSKREKNEDSFFLTDEAFGKLENLYMVCDGMGGHKAGEVASDLAINAFKEKIKECDFDNPTKLLDSAVKYANKVVYDRANSDESKHGMGTTMVACTISDNTLYVSNVGDSRLYIISSDKLKQITFDHSVVEELVRSGAITRDSAVYHQEKHKITRAIGAEGDVKEDIFKISLSPDNYILLCSDGLTNEVSDEEIFTIINDSSDLEEKAEALINRANSNGGHDNITALIIKPF